MFGPTDVTLNLAMENKIGEYRLPFYYELSENQVNTAIDILTEFQKADVYNGLNLCVAHVTEYLGRGGEVVIVENETRVLIDREDMIITGCNAGMCRSQATAGFLRKHGIDVRHVIAGRDSAINYSKSDPNLRDPIASEFDALSFQEVFNCKKLPQVGHHLGKEQLNILDQARKYYSCFMHALSNRTHFLVFGMSGPVVLLHLLTRTGTLEGFKITFFNWADTITHCAEKHSVNAYNHFVEQLKRHLIF